jgi:hypothetical protein
MLIQVFTYFHSCILLCKYSIIYSSNHEHLDSLKHFILPQNTSVNILIYLTVDTREHFSGVLLGLKYMRVLTFIKVLYAL